VTVHIYNLDGYVADTHVNHQLGIDHSSVKHEHDGSVTLDTDQLWMVNIGKFAGKPLRAFEGAVDPRKWDDCPNTKSFFVKMSEVPPKRPWPKVMDETVRLYPGSPNPDVTARLVFDYEVTNDIVKCTFDLDPASPPVIVVDRGWVKATKITAPLIDDRGAPEQVTFFRFRSHKTIKFAKERQVPDPILACLWGWAATRLVDCAG
jgi:hypothetical protein